MNQSEFQIIKQASAILDKEEQLVRKGSLFHSRYSKSHILKFSHAVQSYQKLIIDADDTVSMLVGLVERNVELLSPFWNSELEEHVKNNDYPKDITYKWRMDKEDHGEEWSLTLGDSLIDSWEEAPCYDYPDQEKAKADLQVLYSLGYKFI